MGGGVATEELTLRLRAASRMIGEVAVASAADGVSATIRLDPVLVRARARQQGLADETIAAAAADPRMQRAIAEAVRRVNGGLPPAARIVEHRIAA